MAAQHSVLSSIWFKMPCAFCCEWVDSRHRSYTLCWDADSGTVEMTSLGCNFICESSASFFGNTCASVCEAVASLFEVQRYRVVIHCDPVNASMAIAQIKGEWLRWRLCEAEPPPSYCQRVTWSHSADGAPQCFYFICEKCQRNSPRWRGYTNINFEGAQSTATCDQSLSSSDSEHS